MFALMFCPIRASFQWHSCTRSIVNTPLNKVCPGRVYWCMASNWKAWLDWLIFLISIYRYCNLNGWQISEKLSLKTILLISFRSKPQETWRRLPPGKISIFHSHHGRIDASSLPVGDIWLTSRCNIYKRSIIISPVSEGSGDVMVLRRSRPPPAAAQVAVHLLTNHLEQMA